jgi:SAM-dependent methyltransferase
MSGRAAPRAMGPGARHSVGGVATREERAGSFGTIAADYDRLRPSPAPEALDWLVPPGCDVAVDLAAGTGLFTRPLAARVRHVIAVEPDARMRQVLAERSPGIEVLEGTGESIPVPDASADAVFVSSAWHWLDPPRALPEIARVLRDGGRLGVVWTSRDRDVPWVRDLDRLPGEPAWDGAREHQHRRHRDVDLEHVEGVLFDEVERHNIAFTRRMAVDDVVELAGTYSAVITAEPDIREGVLQRARETVTRHYPGAEVVEFPTRTWCWRGRRVKR